MWRYFDRDCFLSPLFAHAKLGCEEKLKGNARRWHQRLLWELRLLDEICEHAEPDCSMVLDDHDKGKNKASSEHIMSTNLVFDGKFNTDLGDEGGI
jgi:hypothetical protein